MQALWNLDWMLSMRRIRTTAGSTSLTQQSLRRDGDAGPGGQPALRGAKEYRRDARLRSLVMATASRVLAPFDAQAPGRSAGMMAAAEAAWRWAQANPAQLYRQPADILTGEYGDAHVDDEFAWAAAELFIGRQGQLLPCH